MHAGVKVPAQKAVATTDTTRSAAPKLDAPWRPRTVEAQVLHQQRTVGNRAVQRLIRSRIGQETPTAGRAAQRQTAQAVEKFQEPGQSQPSAESAAILPAPTAVRISPRSRQAANTPRIQPAWYNFDIPFTNYQFDPSLEGAKTAAGVVKDAAGSGFEWIADQVISAVSAGVDWLGDKWNSIQQFASSALDSAKNAFSGIIGFISNPLVFLADALMSFDGQALSRAWAAFSGLVTKAANGFKVLTDNLLLQAVRIWGGINGFATSLLNRVSGLTENFLFKKLPDALQKVAFAAVERLRALWKKINDGWTALFDKFKGWIDGAIEKAFGFVRRVASFGINVVIAGIREFGKIVLFLKDLFANPQKYVGLVAKRSVQAFDGVESRFTGLVSQYFGNAKATPAPAPATGSDNRVQPAPAPEAAAESRHSASWGEIGHGVGQMMGKKWNEFKANPMAIITGLLMDMFLPIVGNIKDVVQLFKDIKKIVTGPLSAGSLEELWTSLLQILDIPILIYHTIVSILMRSLMLPLIVATFVPHPLVKGIAAAIGYGLLGAFMQAELMNLGQKLLLLTTGATVGAQKEEAYNRIADSLIALAMAAVITLIMIVLHFIANVMKGVYNLVKGKVFSLEPVQPKQLPPGPDAPKQLPLGPDAPKQLPPGPDAPKQLTEGPAKAGSVDETNAKFSPEERRIADVLASEGKTVEATPRSKTEGVRTRDASVDGRPTEFKTMDPGADSATVRNEVNNSIKGGGQARDMILDARGSGLSEAEATRGLNRVTGITRGKIDSVRIIGDGYDVKRNYR